MSETRTSDQADDGTKIYVDYVLTQAVDNGNCVMLKFLMDRCKTELRDILESEPGLFNKAVSIGNADIVHLLLEAGADVNGVYCKKTPLMNALHPNIIRCLLRNGANINKETNTTTLINAISHSYFENIMRAHKIDLYCDEFLKRVKYILRLLIENGANVEAADDEGNTVLIKSVRNMCHGEIVQLLLDNGSNINRRNRFRQTSLHVAMKVTYLGLTFPRTWREILVIPENRGNVVSYSTDRCLELIKLLIENQADVHATDHGGRTPLLLTFEDNRDSPVKVFEIFKLLISFGADVNHRNNSGMSALAMAVQNMNEAWLSVLLESGANVNATYSAGHRNRTALSILLNKWYPSLRSQRLAFKLLDHGANTKHVRHDVIHRLTALRKYKLIHRLIVNGLCPCDVHLKYCIGVLSIKNISPLGISLFGGNLSLAKYFIYNRFMTMSDIKLLSRNRPVLEIVRPHIRHFLTEASAQPLRLELLSFITVSSSIGSGPDREERIKNASLPNILQEYLMFKKVHVEQNVLNDGDDDIGDNYIRLEFIHKMTKSQIKEVDEDPAFYKLDEQFRWADDRP